MKEIILLILMITNRSILCGCVLGTVSELCFQTHTKKMNYGSGVGWKKQVAVSEWRQQTKLRALDMVTERCIEEGMWEPHSLNKGRRPIPQEMRGMTKTLCTQKPKCEVTPGNRVQIKDKSAGWLGIVSALSDHRTTWSGHTTSQPMSCTGGMRDDMARTFLLMLAPMIAVL